MPNYKLKSAVGHYILVEPIDRSKVLMTEETSTIFRIISVGSLCDDWKDGIVCKNLEDGDLIIVTPGSIEKTMMSDKEVWYVRDSCVVAVITE